MNKLAQKQKQIFNDNELIALNFFIKKNTPIKTEKQRFIENLSLLKTRSHSFNLYKKLITIYNNVNLAYANKFLVGFLEFNELTFNEYLNLGDN